MGRRKGNATYFESHGVDETNGLIIGMDLTPLIQNDELDINGFIEGKMDLQECVMKIKKRTREFVRRQANWFKTSDPRINWFDVTNDRKTDVIEFIKSKEGWLGE